MSELRLASVNIERSKHLSRVLRFLGGRKLDVVCIQELMQRDIPIFEQELGATSIYVGNTIHQAEGNPGVMGLGIFSTLPIRSHSVEYYGGSVGELVDFDHASLETRRTTENRTVLHCGIEKAGITFRIATTHFAWTPDGLPSDFQREDLGAMLAILEQMDPFVLCGDFNAPRGGEIFGRLAARYKDNIPAKYPWSVDLDLHWRGRAHMEREATQVGLPGFMVDGLFTTPRYSAKDVELHNGISDHCAITATIVVV